MDENGEDYRSGEESPPYGYFSDDESSGQFGKSCAHSIYRREMCVLRRWRYQPGWERRKN